MYRPGKQPGFIQEIVMAISATFSHVEKLSARAESGAAKRGFFSRVLAFIVEAREREAERKIAQLAQMNGGMMTDQLERDIDRYAL